MKSLFVGTDVSKYYDLVRPKLSEGVVTAVFDYAKAKLPVAKWCVVRATEEWRSGASWSTSAAAPV